jgi:hypothetical protein
MTTQGARHRHAKRLLAHENALFESGRLDDATHEGATAIWLSTASSAPTSTTTTLYRVMGDAEILALVGTNRLPSTQPYQTIVEGDVGRLYVERYLGGTKRVDSNPTTVVEFLSPRTLVASLFARQHKCEDGCLSHGLGAKGGGDLGEFNASLHDGTTQWRIVTVKRRRRL